MDLIPTVRLKSGNQMPLLGLGTWRMQGQEMIGAIREALELGYRHLDTAIVYENHSALAKAIQGVDRETLFITSKFLMNSFFKASLDFAEQECHRALRELRIEYLDLFLLHWPDRSKSMHAILERATRLIEQGKVRALGVSNFTRRHLEDLDPALPIAVNQIEYHPLLNQEALYRDCMARGIVVTAFSPLLRGALDQLVAVRSIAEKYQKTVAQISLRWLIEKGIAAIPKASTKEHLRENLAIFDFSLTSQEMAQIDQLNQQQRFCQPNWADFAYDLPNAAENGR